MLACRFPLRSGECNFPNGDLEAWGCGALKKSNSVSSHIRWLSNVTLALQDEQLVEGEAEKAHRTWGKGLPWAYLGLP